MDEPKLRSKLWMPDNGGGNLVDVPQAADRLVESAYDHVFGKPGSAYREAMNQKLIDVAESYVVFGRTLSLEEREAFLREVLGGSGAEPG